MKDSDLLNLIFEVLQFNLSHHEKVLVEKSTSTLYSLADSNVIADVYDALDILRNSIYPKLGEAIERIQNEFGNIKRPEEFVVHIKNESLKLIKKMRRSKSDRELAELGLERWVINIDGEWSVDDYALLFKSIKILNNVPYYLEQKKANQTELHMTLDFSMVEVPETKRAEVQKIKYGSPGIIVMTLGYGAGALHALSLTRDYEGRIKKETDAVAKAELKLELQQEILKLFRKNAIATNIAVGMTMDAPAIALATGINGLVNLWLSGKIINTRQGDSDS